jgi:hypothetical protein
MQVEAMAELSTPASEAEHQADRGMTTHAMPQVVSWRIRER